MTFPVVNLDAYAAADSGTYVGLAERGWTLPTGAVAQTFERTGALSNGGVLSTGRLSLVGIYLRAGQVVSTITFVSSNTALSSGTNQWFALYSAARAKLGVTNDDTSTAWGATSAKTLTLDSPYTVTASGMYYLGICVVATTVPSLAAASLGSHVTGIAPIVSGSSDSGLTGPASAPATAAVMTALSTVPYGYVS